MSRPWHRLGLRCPTCHDLVVHVEAFISTMRYEYYNCPVHGAVDPVWDPQDEPPAVGADASSDRE